MRARLLVFAETLSKPDFKIIVSWGEYWKREVDRQMLRR